MRFSYGRVAFFEDFEHWNIRCYFGAVLGRSWGGFWALLSGFKAFKTSQISKPKLEPEKVVSKT